MRSYLGFNLLFNVLPRAFAAQLDPLEFFVNACRHPQKNSFFVSQKNIFRFV